MATPRPSLLFPRRSRVYPVDSVTRIAPDEVSGRSVGLSAEAVDQIWRSVVNFYRMGLHPALSLCVRVRGQVVLDRAIGHSRGNGPGADPDGERVQATPETPFNLFSASKVVTAMLVMLAVEKGQVDLDEPVSRWIPDFAQKGKGGVTVRHVLTHRAGIPWVPGDSVDLDVLSDPVAVLSRICALAPISTPGQEAAYHALSGGFLLAEVLRKATGKPIQTLLFEQIRQPLGFQNLGYGVPRPMLHQVARDSFTGPSPPRPFARMLKQALGLEMEKLVEVANDPRFMLAVVPSGNVVATAREACRFMELLRCGGALDGVRVFQPKTVSKATSRQRSSHEIDRIIKMPIRYGLGFMLGSDHLSLYGQGTPKAFGHLGFTNVVIWTDPERHLSVALLNNGKPFVTPELLLWLNVMRTISQRTPRTR